jgi:protocatechuate 3,4-dioxygenase beta subunit
MAEVSRRQALAGLGSVSLAVVVAACSDDEEGPAAGGRRTPTEDTTGGSAAEFDQARSCTVTAEQTEGPFYFDVDEIRGDIREDRDGETLRLGVRVRDADGGCEPLPDAVVDIWHCDAEGNYSADGETFLRGAQVTDRDGVVEFTTIYPGSYPGRTRHIHAKVHLDRRTVLTTQFYFPGDAGNDADGLYDPDLELTLLEQGDGRRARITLDVRRA